MALHRMCKLKQIKEKTGGLLTPYKARILFLQGIIPGVRLGGENSPILLDLDGLEEWLNAKCEANVRHENEPEQEYGKIRRI